MRPAETYGSSLLFVKGRIDFFKAQRGRIYCRACVHLLALSCRAYRSVAVENPRCSGEGEALSTLRSKMHIFLKSISNSRFRLTC